MSDERLIALINHLRSLPRETEWVEFKVDNSDPQVLGKRISALSNGARLKDRSAGFLAYGVEDGTHKVVGTRFKGDAAKAKGQPLLLWLSQHLDPTPVLNFSDVAHPEGRVVLIEISAAMGVPTKFDGHAYIRLGEATPRLSDHQQLEKQLWSRLQSYAWEKDEAMQYVSSEAVLALLDHKVIFSLLSLPATRNPMRALEVLQTEGMIVPDVGGRWNVLNLGACLLAKDLRRFERVSRKAVRLIQYEGLSRVRAKQEIPIVGGYAVEFEPLIDKVMDLTALENIGSLRLKSQPFPRVAVRELVANALIHQDMTATGAGPTVEIFDDRIEITNPGKSLVEPKRFIDMPPRSRNETLAAIMRRMRICEERGSGIDRVIETVEEGHLPAPDFVSEAEPSFTRATLLGPRAFASMTATERIRACYQHTCLLNEQGKWATNGTLRARFDVPASNSTHISRVFKETRESGLIKLADPAHPKGGYIPDYA